MPVTPTHSSATDDSVSPFEDLPNRLERVARSLGTPFAKVRGELVRSGSEWSPWAYCYATRSCTSARPRGPEDHLGARVSNLLEVAWHVILWNQNGTIALRSERPHPAQSWVGPTLF
jgi:hypothetical protein